MRWGADPSPAAQRLRRRHGRGPGRGGPPADLAAAGSSDAGDEALRASHQRAIDLVGDDVGTPVIAVEGVAFFGRSSAPRHGAKRLADCGMGCVLVAGTDGFFELKRTRTRGPIFDQED